MGGDMLNFEEIKRVRITDVVGRYGLKLRFKGEWGSAACPLPTHKAGDRGRNFTVNVRENYWRCFSETCNANNEGRKGGDVINFVALMENCRERDAAQKLAGWYGLNGNGSKPIPKIVSNGTANVNQLKTAPHIEARPESETPANHLPDNTSPAVAGKGAGYMQALKPWWDELVKCGDWEVIRRAVFSKIHESYRNGKTAKV
jgi:hypothetical protein